VSLRELATQLFLEALKFSYRTMLRPCVIYGGADGAIQKTEVLKGCDILVGTPGRLLDFLERRIVSLRSVKYVLL
jgi:ATP-dependent RNA helicase DDX3X